MTIVVGIVGYMRSGKDTIAQRLVERWDFTRVSFADGLKEEVLARMPRTLRAIHKLRCDEFSTTRCACESEDVADEGLRAVLRKEVYVLKSRGVRELLQEYGTDVRRADDPDYWIRVWASASSAHPRVVVPDVRFPNEAETILAMGGTLWKVERPLGTDSGDARPHISETALDQQVTHARFHNSGTIADLWALVDQAAPRAL